MYIEDRNSKESTMNINTSYNPIAAGRYQQSAAAPTSEPSLESLYGTDQVTIGQSGRGLAEGLLLADCIGDAGCISMDKACHGY